MKQAPFNLVAGGLFAFIAVGHLLRLIFRWEVIINGYTVPHWPSAIVVVLFGYLGYSAWTRKP
jgi:hypothetical protein